MVSEAQKRASVKYQEEKMVARTIKGSSPRMRGAHYPYASSGRLPSIIACGRPLQSSQLAQT